MGSMGPPMMGPPPAELWPRFKIIKYCILTLLICTLLRIMSGSFVPDVKIGGVIWNSVSIVLVAIFGIFLMKDDALLGQAHRFLATTCCQWCDQNCGGGMNCLLPFVIYSALNVILDLLFGVIGDVVKMVELFFNPSDWTTGLEGFWVGLNVISIISIYAAQKQVQSRAGWHTGRLKTSVSLQHLAIGPQAAVAAAVAVASTTRAAPPNKLQPGRTGRTPQPASPGRAKTSCPSAGVASGWVAAELLM
eukprot:CAMPEP_0171062304 /NCGR_PEP_ID=MMETSP0766_2-20121228/4990_1 /TAXON_ID=439317 /ORGANISM="Gambierdiscus australes, Strain CAWD 149" /LENGTH=247 /DNA_ID=CAMNT_0011518101 /DNA_START=73 /DNA_END=817 /DNA_ORIENTATION=+